MRTATKEEMGKLIVQEELTFILSACTKQPFVVCDEESFDDEIYLYPDEASATEGAKKLLAMNEPVAVGKITKKAYIPFFTSLHLLGVNAVVVNAMTEDAMRVDLNLIIPKPDGSKLPKGQILVMNPEFALTASYMMQRARNNKKYSKDDVKEFEEEMLTHFREGRYVVPMDEETKAIPVVKDPTGKSFMPIFTDIPEFLKFKAMQKGRKVVNVVATVPQIAATMPKQAEGVAVNPLNLNMVLNLKSTAPAK